MHRFLRGCVVILLTIAAAESSVIAERSPPPLTNEAEMEAVIVRYIDNPRATFDIVIRARNEKLCLKAADLYRNLLKKHQNDANVQSAFAFSQFEAIGPYWTYAAKSDSPELISDLKSEDGRADQYRKAVVTKFPKSPEFLLEAGIFYCNHEMLYGSPDLQKGYELIHKAVVLSPKWVDAYYWQSKALVSMLGRPESVRERAVFLLQSLRSAEKLQPKMHSDCLSMYAHAYGALDDPVNELHYLDAALKAHPEYLSKPGVVKWREGVAEQVRKLNSNSKPQQAP